MKTNYKLIICLSFFFSSIFAYGQYKGLKVVGKGLVNSCNDTIVPLGINYSVLDDWEFPANISRKNNPINEIAKTGCNIIRLQWYKDYGQKSRPAYSLVDLDSLITQCAANGMVPVLGLWDLTCGYDWNVFDTTVLWWTQPAVVQLVKKHEKYLVINIFNEFGYYEWTNDTLKALDTFVAHYSNAVKLLRRNLIKVPLMVDAPDCGQNPDALIRGGKQLLLADSLQNVILSVHSYWNFYGAGNDSLKISSKIKEISNSKLPFIFGEIANFQTVDPDTPCQFPLAYKYALAALKKEKIGWMAWTWFKDYCNQREMADSGLFRNLSPYGLDLVNNSHYGILSNSIKKNCTFYNQQLPIESFELKYTLLEKTIKVFVDRGLVEEGNIQFEFSNNISEWFPIMDNGSYSANSFFIELPLSKMNQYRFARARLMEKDGKQLYSNILQLPSESSDPFEALTISPNPFTSLITINPLPPNSMISIYSSEGKLLMSKPSPNKGIVKLNATMLKKGLYLLCVKSYFGTKTFKIVKE